MIYCFTCVFIVTGIGLIIFYGDILQNVKRHLAKKKY